MSLALKLTPIGPLGITPAGAVVVEVAVVVARVEAEPVGHGRTRPVTRPETRPGVRHKSVGRRGWVADRRTDPSTRGLVPSRSLDPDPGRCHWKGKGKQG